MEVLLFIFSPKVFLQIYSDISSEPDRLVPLAEAWFKQSFRSNSEDKVLVETEADENN